MDRGQDAADASSEGQRPAKRRARGALACQRCKTRKQRCDNDFPSCSSCLSAGEVCSYGFKQIYPAKYVSSLEKRIAELEKGATPVQTAAAPQLPNMAVFPTQHLAADAVASPEGNDVAEEGESNAESGSGAIALSPNSFLGTSSGFPLAKLLKSAISTSDDPSRIGRSTTKGIITFAPHLTAPYETGIHRGPLVPSGRADMPTDEVGRKLIDTYYSRIHPKHPFLSKKKIMRLHNARANLVPAHKVSPSTENRADLCDYSILHLVYAIGGRYLQLAPDNKHQSPSVSW